MINVPCSSGAGRAVTLRKGMQKQSPRLAFIGLHLRSDTAKHKWSPQTSGLATAQAPSTAQALEDQWRHSKLAGC